MTNPEDHHEQDERRYIPRDVDFDSLLVVLVTAKIPVEKFGVGAAKTVQHLLDEVAEGESVLSIDAKGNLFRELEVLWLDVKSVHANGDVYVLKEDRQVFNDGRVKRRTLDASLGEKLKPGEDPAKAVTRALAEELGVESGIELVEFIGEENTLYTPDTYPELESSYRFYKYGVVISEDVFKAEGYIEYQADKTNYYVWEKVSKNI